MYDELLDSIIQLQQLWTNDQSCFSPSPPISPTMGNYKTHSKDIISSISISIFTSRSHGHLKIFLVYFKILTNSLISSNIYSNRFISQYTFMYLIIYYIFMDVYVTVYCSIQHPKIVWFFFCLFINIRFFVHLCGFILHVSFVSWISCKLRIVPRADHFQVCLFLAKISHRWCYDLPSRDTYLVLLLS